jgi:ADP-heptose:LPS heptosyltransferase
MISVLIDRKTRTLVSIVEGQKIRSTEEYDTYHTTEIDESSLLAKLKKDGLMSPDNLDLEIDILFKRDALGDVLMLLPVIEGLFKSHPNLNLGLQVDRDLVPLFEDNFLFKYVGSLDHSIEAKYEIDLRSVGNIVYGRENKRRTEYFEDYVRDKLKEYDFDLDYSFNLYFNESEKLKNSIISLKNKKVVLAPKSNSYYRMWGYRTSTGEIYYKEIDLIKRCLNWDFIILGSEYLPEFDGMKHVLNLSGQTDILDCTTVCKYADLAIVPDSGIMHLLGSLKIPTIALFGNVSEPSYRISNYETIFPIQTPTRNYVEEIYKKKPYCHIKNCFDGKNEDCEFTLHEKWCTKEISVDDVLNAYKTNIEKNVKLTKLKKRNVSYTRLDTKIICTFKSGGIGDMVDYLFLLRLVRNKYPKSYIKAVATCNTRSFVKIMNQLSIADEVVHKDYREFPFANAEFSRKYAKAFDLFYDFRPYIGRVLNGSVSSISDRDDPNWFKKWSEYYYSPLSELQNFLASKYKKNHLYLTAESCYLDYDENIYSPIPAAVEKKDLVFFDKDWVSISISVDGMNQGKKSLNKLWLEEYWNEVVTWLQQENIFVVQVGIGNEKKLDNVDYYYWDQDFNNFMFFLKKSPLHISTENGTVRLRKMVTNKSSIVLFGPTNKEFFGFSTNINLQTDRCPPCFWMTEDWSEKCLRPKESYMSFLSTDDHLEDNDRMEYNFEVLSDMQKICMKSLTPNMVIGAIKKVRGML